MRQLVWIYTGHICPKSFSYLKGDAPAGLGLHWSHMFSGLHLFGRRPAGWSWSDMSPGRFNMEGDALACMAIHWSQISQGRLLMGRRFAVSSGFTRVPYVIRYFTI